MMDYSNFPPPSRAEAATQVLLEVQKVKPGDHFCKEVVDAMPSLGSCTGWHVLFKWDAVKAVIARL